MKWKTKCRLYENGAIRVKCKFLFWPRKFHSDYCDNIIHYEIRWLEYANIKEIYSTDLDYGGWHEIGFAD